MPRVPASVKRSAAMVAIALAVTGLAARAVALESHAPATASFTVQMAAAEPGGPAEPTTTEPFPPIRVEPLPYAPPVGASGDATQSMQQTIVLAIQGGTMSVSPTSANVVLHRHGGRYVGDFGPITVVDARGSLAGWTLVASVASPVSGRAAIRPGAVVALTGRPGEATAAKKGDLTTAGAPIMSAAPQGGGGDFAISGSIDLNSDHVDGDTITVPLAFAVS